ncbi:MAG: hypothetical protein MUE91_07310 [Ignavibacteriaceae bacterium]|jgi:hypothetical protein|nr:hypothetical protein [Ignavibacteriaceae bacterium]
MIKATNTSKALSEMTNALKLFENQIGNIVKTIQPEERLIEVIEPFYVNPAFKSTIKVPKVYRFNQHNNRHYLTVDDFNPEDTIIPKNLVKFFPSVTNIIDKTMPTSFGKLKIIGELGLKGYYKFMRERAFYGTLIHILIADYLRSANSRHERWFEFDSIPGRVSLYIEEHNIDFDTTNWVYEVKKDLASLIQFCIDYEVEPIAVEIVGIYDDGKYRFGGALDLPCECSIPVKDFYGDVYQSGKNKGEPKETKQKQRLKALIDFKSGKHGFFPDHGVQLGMYDLIAEKSLGIKFDRLLNVAPYDWKDVPTYSTKDWTGTKLAKKIPHLLGAYNVDVEDSDSSDEESNKLKITKDILFISGKLNGAGMNEVVKWIPAADYVFNYVRKNFYQDK